MEHTAYDHHAAGLHLVISPGFISEKRLKKITYKIILNLENHVAPFEILTARKYA